MLPATHDDGGFRWSSVVFGVYVSPTFGAVFWQMCERVLLSEGSFDVLLTICVYSLGGAAN